MNFKKKLKAELLKRGLNEGLADMIAVSSDADVSNAIKLLSQGAEEPEVISPQDFMRSEAMTKYILENGFERTIALNKALQSESDKKVGLALETFKAKVMGGEAPPATPETPAAQEGDSEMLKMMKALMGEVADLKKGKLKDAKADVAARFLSESKKIPVKLKTLWQKRITYDETTTDDQIREQVGALEEEYKLLHTDLVGAGSYEFAEGGNDNGSGGGSTNAKELKELGEMAASL